jgi:hypothetical protein
MAQIGRSALFVASLLFASAAACSVETAESSGGAGASITSSTRTFLVPVDERARTLCRDEVNAYYCDPAATEAAINRCLVKIGANRWGDPCTTGSSRCLRVEYAAESCAGSADAVYPSVASCASPRPKNCSFYSACVDRQTSCGEGGYALGYGEKYCTAFKNINGLSSTGVAWRDSVMHCLQQELVPFAAPTSVATCSDILETAFDSHPRCYTRPEHSICFLPPGDVLNVLGTIGGQELLTTRSRTQILATIRTCIAQIGGWLLSSSGAERDAGEAQMELWRSLERTHSAARAPNDVAGRQ